VGQDTGGEVKNERKEEGLGTKVERRGETGAE
jgi:hypothetical protein